jgi:hypothetical protein
MTVPDVERLHRAAVFALFGRPQELQTYQRWVLDLQEAGIENAAREFADQGASAEERMLKVYPRAPLDEVEASALRPPIVTAELWARTRCSAMKAQHVCARLRAHASDHVAVDKTGELIVARWSQADLEGAPAPSAMPSPRPGERQGITSENASTSRVGTLGRPADVDDFLDEDEKIVAEDPLGLEARDPDLAHAFGETS